MSQATMGADAEIGDYLVMPQRNNRRITAGRQLERDLMNQIVTGVLKPGDRLPTDPELSSAYGVSRNTAREAIQALASQGYLVIKQGVGGGVFVAVPTASQVSGSLGAGLTLLTDSAHLSTAQLIEVRQLLEVPAAEFAAFRATDDDLMAMRTAMFDPATLDPAELFVHTRDFHVAILHATHNPLLEIVAAPIFHVLQGRFPRERTPERVLRSIDEDHREILGYIETGDQAGAREAARAHLRFSSRDYYPHMA